MQPITDALTSGTALSLLRPLNRHQTSGDFGVGQSSVPNIFGSNTAKVLRHQALMRMNRSVLKMRGMR